jgi:adenylosuccinate lyase
MAAMEDIALWHERDISHSSVERVIGPDSTILADYMLHRLTGIIGGLVVFPENMKRNLELLKGLIFSQQVLTRLAESGLERQHAYELVQRCALEVWDTGRDFRTLLLEDREIRKYLSEADLEKVFSLDRHFKYVDEIFDRVFGEEGDHGMQTVS